MRHPLLALERVASVCDELMVVTTSLDMLSHERPAAAFYPGGSLGGDMTNWWGFNTAAVLARLHELDFHADLVNLSLSGTESTWGVQHHVGAFHAVRDHAFGRPEPHAPHGSARPGVG